MTPEQNADLLAVVLNDDIGSPAARINGIDLLDWLACAGLVLVNDGEQASRIYLEALMRRAPAIKKDEEE